MRIEQLLYMIEINQTGSISLAAEKLHVSQPNISQAIVSLEEELGVKLLTDRVLALHLQKKAS